MTITPTDEQLAIIDAMAQDGPSIMARAYAGTAKTSTIELAAPKWRKPGFAVAFNKSTTAELAKRLPAQFTCKSFNGLGHGVVARTIGKRLELDEWKLGKLVAQVAKGAGVELTQDQWGILRKTVTSAMLAGITPGDEGEPLLADTAEAWEDLAALAGGEEDELEQLVALGREILAQNNALTRDGVISFDDQVYFSAVLAPESAWHKQPLIIADEWQDGNALNHRQIARMLGKNTRLVLVGDPLQSIYAFRGSLPNSMEQSRALRNGWTDLPLTMTFRCPRLVVARQQGHARGYRAWSGCADGMFRRLGGAQIPWGWGDVPSGDVAVLCRNNAPLLSIGFKLIRRGVGVQMLGRDLGKGLTTLVRKIAKPRGGDDMPIAGFLSALSDWRDRETMLARAAKRDFLFERIEDQAECLIASATGSDAATAGELCKCIERLFTAVGRVTLSTVHQAKGREWTTVVHLDPWRIPSRFAKAEGAAALQQEANALYVLETRTRKNLIEANLGDFE